MGRTYRTQPENRVWLAKRFGYLDAYGFVDVNYRTDNYETQKCLAIFKPHLF